MADDRVVVNDNPTPSEIAFHYNQLWKFARAIRPDLDPSAIQRFTGLVKDESGRPVAGCYAYVSMGLAVLESVWVEPGHRGQGNVTLMMEKLFRAVIDTGCDQIMGYSADFLKTSEVIQRFGAFPFAELDVPALGYKVIYFNRYFNEKKK